MGIKTYSHREISVILYYFNSGFRADSAVVVYFCKHHIFTTAASHFDRKIYSIYITAAWRQIIWAFIRKCGTKLQLDLLFLWQADHVNIHSGIKPTERWSSRGERSGSVPDCTALCDLKIDSFYISLIKATVMSETLIAGRSQLHTRSCLLTNWKYWPENKKWELSVMTE